MKKFLGKLLIFFIPCALYLAMIFVTDPYNYWNNCGIIPLQSKQRISRELNGRLWKVVQFNRAPQPNILLGDSRVDIINTERIKELTGKEYFNFAFPASTLEEIIESFWYASEQVELKNVIIGVNFNLYNKYNNKNLIKPVLESAGAVRYLLNGANIKALSYCFYDMLKKGTVQISKPPMDSTTFWKEKLEGDASQYYKLYKYPDNYFLNLKEIADYCDKNEINLVFYIPPTHIDLQNKIAEHNLVKESDRFKEDIKSLGTVYDFDYKSWLTSHKKNFSDPFHFNIALDTIIINTLINNDVQFARYSTINGIIR